MSKLSSYSRIKTFQCHKVSVLSAPQVSAYTRNQRGMMWKHPSVSEQGSSRGSEELTVILIQKRFYEEIKQNVEAGMWEKCLLTLQGGRRTVKRVVERLREVSRGKDVFHFIKCLTAQGRKWSFVLTLSQEHLKKTIFINGTAVTINQYFKSL